MRHSIRNYVRGEVSRVTLLTKLLPLSTVLFFGALIAGALLFPVPYDWRLRVVSHLISPRHNPNGYLIGSVGMALSAALALPFAGYVERRLRLVEPRAARAAGLAFTVGFALILTVAVPRNAQPTPAARTFHEVVARGSVVAIATGMLWCSVCAVKDRLRKFGGRRSLRGALVVVWGGITLLPLTVGAISGAVKLGEQADHAWAKQVHTYLKESVIWQLAFWEWIGIVMLFVFLFLSVLLLPERLSPGDQIEPRMDTNGHE